MQTRRQFLKGAAVAGAGIAASPILSTPARAFSRTSSADPVKVGLCVPLSGVLALYGKQSKIGAELAVAQLNAKGGILGRKVELSVQDDEGTPAGALRVMRKFAIQDRVDFTLGTIASSEREAVIDFLMKRKLPLVYFQFYEGGASDKYLFCTGANPDTLGGAAYIPWLVKNQGPKVYFLGWDYIANTKISAGFKKWLPKAGGELVGKTVVPFTTTDFTPMLRNAQAAKPDVIYNGMYGSAAFLETLTQLGIKKTTHVTAWAFDSLFLKTLSKPAAANLSWAAEWDNTTKPLPGKVNADFLTALRAKFGRNVPLGLDVQAAYAGFLYYAKAVAKAKSLDPDAVSQAFDGLTFESPAGNLRMSPDNHNVDLPVRTFVSGGKGREYVVSVASQGQGKNPNWSKRNWQHS